MNCISSILFFLRSPHAPKRKKAKLTVVGQLLEAIRTVDRPGTVCTNGDLPLVMPALEVEGLGAMSLPLGKKGDALLF
jgi:hypothetical protein